MERSPDPKWPKTFADRVHWLGLSFSKSDQPALVVLLLLCAAGMGWYCWQRSNQLNGLIDIDRLPSRVVTFQVDINAAQWPEIASLPGIGPSLAAAIVQHRQNHGPFPSLTAIQDVPGIGEIKFQKMLPHLWIGDDVNSGEGSDTTNSDSFPNHENSVPRDGILR